MILILKLQIYNTWQLAQSQDTLVEHTQPCCQDSVRAVLSVIRHTGDCGGSFGK